MPRAMTFTVTFVITLCAGLTLARSALAQEVGAAMTPARLVEIIMALDADAQPTGSGIEFTVSDIPVLVVMDATANRMRAMVPISSTESMTAKDMERVLQANFDSALDARYAIAGGRLWGVFIHPLRELHKDQLISGIAQTVNVAQTYGGLYSSGAGQFGAGDSGGLQAELLEELLRRGQDL